MEQWHLPGRPVENPTIAPRTLFYDDVVAKAIGDGISQVVMLAAGMACRGT